MVLRKISFVLCMTISVLCLTMGYAIARHWIWAVITVLMVPAWLFARKLAEIGLPFICLLLSVSLAVAGRLTGVPPLLMICGSGFALATWDLLLLDVALSGSSSGEHTRHYENEHIRSLILALGLGLIMAVLGRLLTFQVPFVVLILFVLVAIVALDRTFDRIKTSRIDK